MHKHARLKSEEEVLLSLEETWIPEEEKEHQLAQLKVDDGVHLVLEARRISEENQEDQQHAQMKDEEEACIVGKSRLKSQE